MGDLPIMRPTPVVAVVMGSLGEMSDSDLAAAATRAHEQAVSLRDGAVEAAIRAGEILCEAQRRVRARGESWSDWQIRYWQKSETTAKRYMALAHAQAQKISGPRADRPVEIGHASVRAALEAIGYDAGSDRPKDPPAPPAPRQPVPASTMPRGETRSQRSVAESAARVVAAANEARAQLDAEPVAAPEAETPNPQVRCEADHCLRHAEALRAALRYCQTLSVEIETPSLKSAVGRVRAISSTKSLEVVVNDLHGLLTEIAREDRELVVEEQKRIDAIHSQAKNARRRAEKAGAR